MTFLNIAVVGLGRVGSTLINTLEKEKTRTTASPLQLVAACDIDKKKQVRQSGVLFTPHMEEIIASRQVDVVVECIGGTQDAYRLISDSLNAGKHVVTCNRAVMAAYGEKLFRHAQDKGVHLRFEGAVLGAVPCVSALFNGIGGKHPRRFYGVLNSAANYCLQRMGEHGESLSEAVAIATELGLKNAETDTDISGKDALQKAALLRAAAFGVWSDLSPLHTRSLALIAPCDIRLCRQLGFSIKQLAVASVRHVEVAPYLVPEGTLLAATHGTFNSLVVETANAGDVFFAGNAAEVPTAVGGIIDDLLAIAGGARRYLPQPAKQLAMVSATNKRQFYVRISPHDRQEIGYDPRFYVINEAKDEQAGSIGLLLGSDHTRQSLEQALAIEDMLILEVLGE